MRNLLVGKWLRRGWRVGDVAVSGFAGKTWSLLVLTWGPPALSEKTPALEASGGRRLGCPALCLPRVGDLNTLDDLTK